MATKTAKTARKKGADENSTCPECGGERRVVRYVGFGRRGLFWVCDKNCGYMERTK